VKEKWQQKQELNWAFGASLIGNMLDTWNRAKKSELKQAIEYGSRQRGSPR